MADEVVAATDAEREPAVGGRVADRGQRQRRAFAPIAPSGPVRSEEQQRVGRRAERRRCRGSARSARRPAAGRCRAGRRSRCARSSTRESGSSIQSTGTSWMRSPRRWASTSSSVSKNQASSRTSASSASATSRADRLEAALGVGEPRAQRRVQDRVVRARDQLALGAAHHARAVREPRADREVAVAGEQRSDERQQRAQVGREVDVHVADDARVAGRPGGPQRAAAALAVQPQRASTPRQLAGEQRPPSAACASVLALSAITIRQVNGNSVGQEAVQAADAELERRLLVVDGDDDLDVGAGASGRCQSVCGRWASAVITAPRAGGGGRS